MKDKHIGWFNFQENIVVLVRLLNKLKLQDFFLNFIKGSPMRLIPGEYAIKLFALKLYLRDYLETNNFRNKLVDKSCFSLSSI